MQKEAKKVITWIFNYWKTLKYSGITERQLIKKMNNYLDNLMTDVYPPKGLDLNITCNRCKYDQFYRPLGGDYWYRCAACGNLMGKKRIVKPA